MDDLPEFRYEANVPDMFKEDDNLDDIRKLYPDFTDEELQEARENIRRYLSVLIRIAERLQSEGKSIMDLVEESKDEPSAPENEKSTP